MQIPTHNANLTDPTKVPDQASMAPPPRTSATDVASNSVTDHKPPPQTAQSKPTDGGRESTPSKVPGYAETEQMTEERLMTDPDYRQLKEKLESCSGLLEMFHLIDKTVGFRDDNRITMDDIQALVNDTGQPNQAAREAAKWLNDHRDVLFALKGDDNLIGGHDVTNFINGMKGQLKEMKNTVRTDIKAEQGIMVTGAQGTASTSNAASSAQTEEGKKADARAVMAEADNVSAKPAPSQFSGLEGASENLNNLVGWAEAETDRLTTLMGKTDDPAVLKQLEAKINQMSRRMQQMTALMNQIMTAMQNISKMYSDIAMNSVRNMK